MPKHTRAVLQVPLRLVDATLPLPQYQTAGSAAFDLYARETCVIGAKVEALVPLNVVIAVPPGYVLLIAPRSSTFRTKGLLVANSIGVIDNDYHGADDEVMALFYNTRNVPIVVERGERVAQGLFVPIPTVEFVPVLTQDTPSRGGFGSTGTGLPG